MAARVPGGGEGVGALRRGPAGGGRTCARAGPAAPSHGLRMLPEGEHSSRASRRAGDPAPQAPPGDPGS